MSRILGAVQSIRILTEHSNNLPEKIRVSFNLDEINSLSTFFSFFILIYLLDCIHGCNGSSDSIKCLSILSFKMIQQKSLMYD